MNAPPHMGDWPSLDPKRAAKLRKRLRALSRIEQEEADWDLTHLRPAPIAYEPGDILAVSTHCRWYAPRTWLAWRIQHATDSPWNHVAIVARDPATPSANWPLSRP
ncbi:MAG TPA: hypothetical protein VM492_10290 [Sumerlaeia bacterium]|nr:hypothetical protein [Sumerlaeia bacterium]